MNIKRILLLVPIILLIIGAMYCKYITKAASAYALEHQFHNAMTAINMLVKSIEANPDAPQIEKENILLDIINYLDDFDNTYAAVFVYLDDTFTLLTHRHFTGKDLDVLEYPEFIQAALEQPEGVIVLQYNHNLDPDKDDITNLDVYYRWMPISSATGERFLTVIGVSEHSLPIRTHIPMLISYGQWVNVVITFISNMILAILYINRGYGEKRRNNDKQEVIT